LHLEHFFKVVVASSPALCWQLAQTSNGIDMVKLFSVKLVLGVKDRRSPTLSFRSQTTSLTDLLCTQAEE
jgi:predicted alpha/beta superfamily hydrolase